jgi:1-acyl-sn-glycerol-3-phosphate acyltransferase
MNNTASHKKGSIFLDIVCRIWALWALLLFVATLIPAFIFYIPCFFLDDPAKAKWHRNVSRGWMLVFLTLIGCPLRIRGKRNYDMGTNYVVVCNHNSLMDVPVSTPYLPRANKTIAKKSFAKVPVFGWVYKFGSVLVDRNSDSSRRKSYEEMKRVLASGLDMVIYPEGTRNRTGQPLKKFYDGAFRLAVDAKKPVMPVVLLHTREILPADKTFYLRPHSIEMHFLPPVYSEGHSADALKTLVFQQMWDYYALHAPQ